MSAYELSGLKYETSPLDHIYPKPTFTNSVHATHSYNNGSKELVTDGLVQPNHCIFPTVSGYIIAKP